MKINFIKKTFFLLPSMVAKLEKHADKKGVTPSQLLRDIVTDFFASNR